MIKQMFITLPVADLQKSVAFIFGLLSPIVVLAATSEVELNYRLQPNQDIVTDTSIEGVTLMRVTEDRGVIAKSGGRLSRLPTMTTIRRTQSTRNINGKLDSDGSFATEMRYLAQRTSVLVGGKENVLPERHALTGLSIRAVIETDGSIRPGSVQFKGVDNSISEQFRPAIESGLAQAASIPSITVSSEKPVLQQMKMQLPVPGVASFDIKLMVSSQLLGFEGEIAKIQQSYTMDFGSTPSGVIRMKADGTGAGTLRYDTKSQTVVSNDSSMLMRMTIATDDGIIEVRLNSKQAQQTRQIQPTAQ